MAHNKQISLVTERFQHIQIGSMWISYREIISTVHLLVTLLWPLKSFPINLPAYKELTNASYSISGHLFQCRLFYWNVTASKTNTSKWRHNGWSHCGLPSSHSDSFTFHTVSMALLLHKAAHKTQILTHVLMLSHTVFRTNVLAFQTDSSSEYYITKRLWGSTSETKNTNYRIIQGCLSVCVCVCFPHLDTEWKPMHIFPFAVCNSN
jgi:hypothetical protein